MYVFLIAQLCVAVSYVL